MKFILILMLNSYSGSLEHVIFYDKQACEAAFESLKQMSLFINPLRGGCFPDRSQ